MRKGYADSSFAPFLVRGMRHSGHFLPLPLDENPSMEASDIPACPLCAMENTYPDGDAYVCPDCAHEWLQQAAVVEGAEVVVRDVNGNVLNGGDTVVVIKDLKVKGSSIPLKQGTVIRNIRLVDGDAEHIEGSSDKIKGLVLKTCFLKKA
jgi:protein PhnA